MATETEIERAKAHLRAVRQDERQDVSDDRTRPATETEIEAVATAMARADERKWAAGSYAPIAAVAIAALDRVRAEDTRDAMEALRAIAEGRWNTGTGRNLAPREFAREALARVSGGAEDTRDALRYLIERVDREVKATDQAPELDFVLMAANEVRHLAGFSGGASAGGRTDQNDK